MAEVIMLGTGRALPAANQENTYMVLAGHHTLVMVDCAGAPFGRLVKARLDPARLGALIITHFHPDHAYGAPSLLLSLWLAGRSEPLDLCGPQNALSHLRETMHAYGAADWPGMFPLHFHPISLTPGAPVLVNSDFEITASPGTHFVPTVGLRVRDRATMNILVYSSDTQPDPRIADLARGADLLIHEATGEGQGHSSAAEAAAIAQQAGARRLVLIHYDRNATPPARMRREARKVYAGEVAVARDYDRFAW